MTSPPLRKTKIICIANQKGGVGKTTTAVNLAAGLSILRKSVLLVDCDAQGNATSGLGIGQKGLDKHLYHAILGLVSAAEAILPTSVANLSIIPSNMDLVGIEVDLAGRKNREGVLKELLAPLSSFDYILLDCPPLSRPDNRECPERLQFGDHSHAMRILCT